MSLRLTHQARRERRRDMARLVDQGASIVGVAQLHGVTTQTVRSACREFGAALAIDVTVLRIVARLQAGEPVQDIARAESVTASDVRRVARECAKARIKIARRGRGRRAA